MSSDGYKCCLLQCRDEFRCFNTFQFKALSFNTYNVGFINIFLEIKECFTTVKQVVFSYTTQGSLVDTTAYKPYTLVGPTV